MMNHNKILQSPTQSIRMVQIVGYVKILKPKSKSKNVFLLVFSFLLKSAPLSNWNQFDIGISSITMHNV